MDIKEIFERRDRVRELLEKGQSKNLTKLAEEIILKVRYFEEDLEVDSPICKSCANFDSELEQACEGCNYNYSNFVSVDKKENKKH